MQTIRRITFIALWTLAVTGFWPWLMYGAMRLIVWGQRTRGWPPLDRWLPAWADSTVVFGLLCLATILTSVATLLLGLRGRLPGTRNRRAPAARGFTVGPAGQPGIPC